MNLYPDERRITALEREAEDLRGRVIQLELTVRQLTQRGESHYERAQRLGMEAYRRMDRGNR